MLLLFIPQWEQRNPKLPQQNRCCLHPCLLHQSDAPNGFLADGKSPRTPGCIQQAVGKSSEPSRLLQQNQSKIDQSHPKSSHVHQLWVFGWIPNLPDASPTVFWSFDGRKPGVNTEVSAPNIILLVSSISLYSHYVMSHNQTWFNPIQLIAIHVRCKVRVVIRFVQTDHLISIIRQKNPSKPHVFAYGIVWKWCTHGLIFRWQ